MNFRTVCIALILVCSLPAAIFADGKFYYVEEEIPIGIPYQRAVIAHDGAQELLVLQVKFEGKAEEFGWVIPIPTVPELATLPSDYAKDFFFLVNWGSQPYVTRISETFLTIVVLILLFLAGAFFVLFIVSCFKKKPIFKALPTSRALLLASFLLLFVCVVTVGAPSLLSVRGMEGVDVLVSEQVGVYDVKVIKATDSGKLIEWLNKYNYRFGQEDETVFADYVKKDWCFVTAQINLSKTDEEEYRSDEGLVNPLVMLFESKDAVYPLALTGTAGQDVEVLLYVFADHKVTTDGRLKLRFAGRKEFRNCIGVLVTDPLEFLDHLDENIFRQGYLTKFKGILKPEEMSEDIVLQRAADDSPYREQITKW